VAPQKQHAVFGADRLNVSAFDDFKTRRRIMIVGRPIHASLARPRFPPPFRIGHDFFRKLKLALGAAFFFVALRQKRGDGARGRVLALVA
jgi:hypothetical protein